MSGFTNDIMNADNVNFTGIDPTIGTVTTNGQLLIGATSAPNIKVGTLTSPDSSITIGYSSPNITLQASTSGVSSVTGTANQITASPTTGAVVLSIPSTFIAPGSIASTTTTTGGTGLIATTGNVTVTNGNLTLPTTSSTVGQIIVNSSRFMHSFGGANTFLGQSAGNFTLSSGNCTAIGYFSGSSLTSGNNNTFVGMEAGQNVNSGSENTAVGFQSLVTCQSGVQNCAIGRAALNNCSGDQNTMVGYNAGATISSGIKNTGVGNQALISLGSGNENIGIGYNSGISYTGSESNNIIFANNGVVGESNTIRIGTAGTQTRAFVQGISGVTVAASAPTSIDTNGQLSSLGFGTSGQVLTSNGAGVSPSWQSNTQFVILKAENVVDMKVLGTTLLFTSLPANFIASDIVFYGVSITGTAALPQLNVGWTATNYNDLFSTFSPALTVTADFAPTSIGSLTRAASKQIIPASTQIFANVTTTTNTQQIYLLGYYLF